MTLKTCWLVDTPVGGDALFLERSRAEEHIRRYGGILVTMYGQTSNPGLGVGQARQETVASTEQLHQNSSPTMEVCQGSGDASTALSTCGNAGPDKAEGRTETIQDCN